MFDEIENKLLKVAVEIEKLVETHEIDYIDACILYCQQNNIEVEQLGDIVRNNSNLKSKVQKEAENLRFLKKTSRLKLT